MLISIQAHSRTSFHNNRKALVTAPIASSSIRPAMSFRVSARPKCGLIDVLRLTVNADPDTYDAINMQSISAKRYLPMPMRDMISSMRIFIPHPVDPAFKKERTLGSRHVVFATILRVYGKQLSLSNGK